VKRHAAPSRPSEEGNLVRGKKKEKALGDLVKKRGKGYDCRLSESHQFGNAGGRKKEFRSSRRVKKMKSNTSARRSKGYFLFRRTLVSREEKAIPRGTGLETVRSPSGGKKRSRHIITP